MKRELIVQSTVIDWPDQTLEIATTAVEKHIIPLGWTIEVTMVGYPERETKTMLAGELGDYMSKGYIIEKISFETEQ